jgi:hypothetical protein
MLLLSLFLTGIGGLSRRHGIVAKRFHDSNTYKYTIYTHNIQKFFSAGSSYFPDRKTQEILRRYQSETLDFTAAASSSSTMMVTTAVADVISEYCAACSYQCASGIYWRWVRTAFSYTITVHYALHSILCCSPSARARVVVNIGDHSRPRRNIIVITVVDVYLPSAARACTLHTSPRAVRREIKSRWSPVPWCVDEIVQRDIGTRVQGANRHASDLRSSCTVADRAVVKVRLKKTRRGCAAEVNAYESDECVYTAVPVYRVTRAYMCVTYTSCVVLTRRNTYSVVVAAARWTDSMTHC